MSGGWGAACGAGQGLLGLLSRRRRVAQAGAAYFPVRVAATAGACLQTALEPGPPRTRPLPPQVLRQLQQGAAVALVSDAGTPAINDPGAALVAAAAQAGLPVIPVPGASAVLAALVAAGLPTDRFLFCGFAAAKPSARRRQLAGLAGVDATLVLYVSPHALLAALEDAAAALGGERRCASCARCCAGQGVRTSPPVHSQLPTQGAAALPAASRLACPTPHPLPPFRSLPAAAWRAS